MRTRRILTITSAMSLLVIAGVALGTTGSIVVRDGNAPACATNPNNCGISHNFSITIDGLGNYNWNYVLVDGGGSGNAASVKAPSTAALQTDSAAVFRSPDIGTISDAAYTGGGASSSAIAALRGLVSIALNPIPGLARTNEQTPAINGNAVGLATDKVGKLITKTYANPENDVTGAASTNGTASTILIAAQGATNKIYITGAQCSRNDTASSPVIVTFGDTAATTMVLPNNGGGGGNNATYPTPIRTLANAPFTYTVSAAITTTFCNAQGYFGQ